MTAAPDEFQSHPNIGEIYDDMMHEAESPNPHRRVQAVTVTTKTFDGADAPKKIEKRTFSRKNSTDSAVSVEQLPMSSIRPMGHASRRASTDSALSIYNDDELWSQRIEEIMNRGVVVTAPPSINKVHQQAPVKNVRVSPSSATASSSLPKFRRRQSTDCPFTISQAQQQGSENAWMKKQQFRGGLSRRNSMEGGNNKELLARKNSRSSSPKFVLPMDSFDSNESKNESAMKNSKAFSRRDSMSRASSAKFIEPLSSSDHDFTREFKGTRRHTVAEHDSFYSFGGPSTPKSDAQNEHGAAPGRPLSRRNSVEGVDPSIFPTLPMTEEGVDNDPNDEIAMMFDCLVREDEADGITSDEDEEEEDNVIQRHMKSKMRRRCSTGGFRTFERENFRSYIEDTEGEEPVQSAPKVEGRGSLFRKCSTGGIRTFQRENSKDLYSDDCSLDGAKEKLHLSDDASFDAYLRKMSQEAVVDTSNDEKIINRHVGATRRRSSIHSVGSFAVASEDPVDFASFIGRVGQGFSGSDTVTTAANTSSSGESGANAKNIENSGSSCKKSRDIIHVSSAMNESLSSLENSAKGKGSPIPRKDLSDVNFGSSNSRSIRRLASNEGIDEMKKSSPKTRRSSGSVRTPDPEEIVLDDLPRKIKDIDRDLVTERSVYQKGRGSPNAKARKPLEPPGVSASDMEAMPSQRSVSEDEDPPLSSVVLRGAQGASIISKYQPKRRRASRSKS